MNSKDPGNPTRRSVIQASAAAIGGAMLSSPLDAAAPQVPTIANNPLPPPIGGNLEQTLTAKLTDIYKAKLRVTALDQHTQAAIARAASLVAQRSTERDIELEANKIVREVYQPVHVNQLIANRLTQAKDGARLVTQSSDLQDILNENAVLLRKKFKALTDAGFTEDQAFQLVRAEVEGKAARRATT